MTRVPAFELPLSSYMSEEAKRAFLAGDYYRTQANQTKDLVYASDEARFLALRDDYEQSLAPRLKALEARFPVAIEKAVIANVRVDVVTPKNGVSARNAARVLINLHGGAFYAGAVTGGLVESVPIAAVGRIKVITVDYRQGPEHVFPAASEDVAAVYRELLKHYPAENIGLFGCSAGGMLTAQAVAWLQKEKLPRPGAIGIVCAGADVVTGGDARYFSAISLEQPPPLAAPNPPRAVMPYLQGADPYSPLVSPAFSPAVLSQFPPTLVITGSRDMTMSAAIHTHARLVSAGAEADLHVWDGMWHAFMNWVDLPEAHEAYDVTVKFFDRHLGVAPR